MLRQTQSQHVLRRLPYNCSSCPLFYFASLVCIALLSFHLPSTLGIMVSLLYYTALISSIAATAQSTSCSTLAASSSSYTDSCGNTYALTCGHDYPCNDLGPTYANSFQDCFTYCSTSTIGCTAFAFNGGSGSGFCYLKSANCTAGNNTAVDSARLVSAGSVASSSKCAFASSATTVGSFCPGVNNTYITDSNGTAYLVRCNSDSATISYTSANASTSYLDCMGLCDSGASAGCTGFVYVGGYNGTTPGTCYLKKGPGLYSTEGSNYIAASRSSTAVSTTTGTSTTTPTSTMSTSTTSTSTH